MTILGYLSVLDARDREEVGVFRKELDFGGLVPRSGDYVEAYGGQHVRVENVLWKPEHVELFFFSHDSSDVQDTLDQLLSTDWVEVDQHGDPVPASAPADEAAPADEVAEAAAVV